MTRKRKMKKVVRFRRRLKLTTGLFILFFTAYILYLFIHSMTRDHVSIAEVTEKQIADDSVVRALVLRQESVVKAKKAGFINYYVGNAEKVAVNSKIYSLDQTGEVANQLAGLNSENTTLSDEDTREIRTSISSYQDSRDLSNYQNILNFRYNIDNTLLALNDASALERLQSILKQKGRYQSFKVYRTSKCGIISFSVDGNENLSIGDITAKQVVSSNESWKQLREASSVKAGDPVYKLVTSDEWQMVFPLTSEQYKLIYDKKYLSVIIKKDGLHATPQVSTFMMGSTHYAKLTFQRYMIRYLNDRYLNLEIQFNNVRGLKIPVTSLFKKKFYVIPKEYINKGGDSDATGVVEKVYDKAGKISYKFVPADIYYEDEKNNVYIDKRILKAGTMIVKKLDPSKSILLTNIKDLLGVYNCNQGYCQFRRIALLYKNQEYAIVSADAIYGLTAFDHIILNPKLINDDDIIY